MFAPTVVASPRTATFTAPCPDCGTAVTWTQSLGERVTPEQFVIACPCTTPPRGPSHVAHP